MRGALTPLGALARAADYDLYLSAVFAPPARREALFALIAFNHEASRIPGKVSEPMLGHIRFQWWRETLEALDESEKTRRHEIVPPLAAALRAGEIDRGWLFRILDAHEDRLSAEGPADRAALERRCAAVGGLLTALMLQAAGAGSPEAQAAGRRVGTAWALTGVLRAVARHAAEGRVLLPADLMTRAGITVGDLQAGRAFDRLAEVGGPVAQDAADALRDARRVRRAVPRKARAVLLIARLADLHLARLRRAGYDPRDRRLAPGPLRRQAAMFAGAASGRY